MNPPKNRECARLIRKIIVAKILSLPLGKYRCLIRKIEADFMFKKIRQARPKIVLIKKLPGTRYQRSSASSKSIASINHFPVPIVVYHQRGLNKEYHIDMDVLNKWISTNGLNELQLKQIDYIKNKLELINVRNKMCCLILSNIAFLQKDYLQSKDPLSLKVLSQKEFVEWINRCGHHNPIIDESRVSRLISHLFIKIDDSDNSNEIPLKKLFPTKKAILKYAVSKLIHLEREEVQFCHNKMLYTDEQIALKLNSFNVSRRTIAHCRKCLGIPNRHKRAKNCGYQYITQKYSSRMPLSKIAVKTIPDTSGVYELSVQDCDIEYPKGKSKVFYVGSGNNIRARLREHMRTGTPNGTIRKHFACFDIGYCHTTGRQRKRNYTVLLLIPTASHQGRIK